MAADFVKVQQELTELRRYKQNLEQKLRMGEGTEEGEKQKEETEKVFRLQNEKVGLSNKQTKNATHFLKL